MSINALPDELLSNIAERVGRDHWWRLGPLLRTWKRGLRIVYMEEVLKNANIFSMCSDPEDICLAGRNRKIFAACIAAGNSTALYYEGLHLVTEFGDIEGGIKLLEKNVPSHADATFAAGMFSICLGNSENGGRLFEILGKNHYGLETDEVRDLGEELIREIRFCSPPHKNTYAKTFKYPENETIKTPPCAYTCSSESGPNENLCNSCYLWWYAVRICSMLSML